jgi:lysophospholipase L1-like esterase
VAIASSPRGLPGHHSGVARRPPAWLVLIVFGGAMVLFVAVLAEVALRVGELRDLASADPRCAGSDTAQLTQKGLYTLDPAAGYVMRPNLCVRLRTTEYDEVLRTNSRGLPGPELPPTKPVGEFRIVVLGDSYTVGGQVPYAQLFPAVLEQELRTRGYTQVRVVDAGVGGYTTYNEAGLLRENLSWLQPDLVVVAAFLGNDVGENVLATDAGYVIDPEHPKGFSFGPAASDLVQESISWFPRNGGQTSQSAAPPAAWDSSQPLPTPVPSTSTLPEPPRRSGFVAPWPIDPSPINTAKNAGHWVWDTARVDSRVLGRLFGQPADPSISTAPGQRPPSKDQRKLNVSSFEWTILRDVPRTYWLDTAWPLFGEYLADIRASAASVGAPAMMVVIPEIAQVEPSQRARTMADYRFREDEVDWTRPQRELLAQATRAGVPVVDLLPAFSARPDRDGLYLPIDEHFSALGHRVTAQLLADAIVANNDLGR